MQEAYETQVLSLGREDPLEKEMATHSSILAWKILWTEQPGELKSWGFKQFDMTEQLTTPDAPAFSNSIATGHIDYFFLSFTHYL